MMRITNRQSFVGLESYIATWSLLVDGVVTKKGTLTLPPIAPHASIELPLPCDVPAAHGEVHLTVRFALKRATWFAPAGHVVAWDQLELRPAGPSRRTPITPNHIEAAVDEILISPVELTLWRAAVDNDGFKLMPELAQRIRVGGQALRRWQEAGVDTAPADELVDHHWDRSVAEDGSVVYRHTVVVPNEMDDLPRIGVTFAVPVRFGQVRWFGRGPGENYPDRRSGSTVGVWQGVPDESPYLVPQEFGLRTDCRWFELIDPTTHQTVRVDVVRPLVLHCSATHVTAADVFAAPTATELRPRAEVIVHLDLAHRGLGTASCGPDVLPQYRIRPGRYDFAYRLTFTE